MTHRQPTLISWSLAWIAPLILATPLAAQQAAGGMTTAAGEGPSASLPEAALPVQWADFDRDGLDDALVVTTEGRLALLQSRPNGTFLDMTEWAGLDGMANVLVTVFQDHDHDGWADLFVGTADGRAYLMQNMGGPFLDVTSGSGITAQGAARSAHWMDYDADGLLDLHLVTERENILFHARGSWSFEPITLPLTAAGGQVTTVDTSGDEDGPGTDGTGFRPATPPMRPVGQGLGAGPGLGSLGDLSGGPPSGVGARSTSPQQGSAPGFGCANAIGDAGGSGCLQASSVPTLGMLYPLTDKLFVDDATGRVGVGTTSPEVPLHVVGGSDVSLAGGGYAMFGAVDGQNITVDGNEIMARTNGAAASLIVNGLGGEVHFGGQSGAGPTRVGIGTTTPSGTLEIIESGFETGLIITETVDNRGSALALKNNARTWLLVSDSGPDQLRLENGPGTPPLTIDGVTGFVGIGTASPTAPLHVPAGARLGGTEITGSLAVLDELSVSNRTNIYHDFHATGDIILATGFLKRVGIGVMTPDETLDVNGAIKIRGGADIVETFESSCGTLEPGTVVVIDPANPGALMCSRTAYDTKVAGVVSGAGGINPGLLLGQDDMFAGDTKVAMTGRVYVNCSTENGPIVPGDRLTTATREGHAMRVNEELPSSGCVIGKAMSSLDDGTGLVLVLVNLQ